MTALLLALALASSEPSPLCERLGEEAYYSAELDGLDYVGATARADEAIAECEAWEPGDNAVDLAAELAKVEPLLAYLDSTGGFGATTHERAYIESGRCGTPVAFTLRVSGDRWVAVCADAEGVPVSYRGAL